MIGIRSPRRQLHFPGRCSCRLTIRTPIRGARIAALTVIAVAILKLFSAIFGASASSTGSRRLSGWPLS
jgi:hypothetical protein